MPQLAVSVGPVVPHSQSDAHLEVAEVAEQISLTEQVRESLD